MSDELIEIVDDKDQPMEVDRTIRQAHRDGSWHRSAQLWIYNSRGEVLLQLRSKNMDIFPGKWDLSVGGHVKKGESPAITAVRETREEIGISVKEEELEFMGKRCSRIRFNSLENNEYNYIFLLKRDVKAEELVIQEAEVDGIGWFGWEQVIEDCRKNPDKYTSGEDYWEWIMGEIGKRTKSSRRGQSL